MAVKVIGIGNVLMGDDAIGIKVLRHLQNRLEEADIQVIFGETDFNYCISLIDKLDQVFIIDAMISAGVPGQVSLMSVTELKSNRTQYDQHNSSLIDLLKSYYSELAVYVIGIEIDRIECCYGISDKLEKDVEKIACSVLELIVKYVI